MFSSAAVLFEKIFDFEILFVTECVIVVVIVAVGGFFFEFFPLGGS